MTSTSSTPRARVAAQLHVRDYGHLIGQIRCVVYTDSWKISGIIAATGRDPILHPVTGHFYPRDPVMIDTGNAHLMTCMRNVMSTSKRLTALLRLSIATGTQIIFEGGGTRERIEVDCDPTCTDPLSRTPEALDAAACWMRVEYGEAIRALMGRARGECPDFRFEFPDDPADCIRAIEAALATIAQWVDHVLEPAPVTLVGAEAVARLAELLNGVSSRRLSRAQADRLNEARAIAQSLAEAA